MSYLKKQLYKVILPTDKNYWVEIDKDFTYGDVKSVGANLEGSEASDKFLQLAIKNWNLDNEEGNILEITLDNINLLKKDDVLVVIEAITKEAEDQGEKKDSSS